MAECEKHIVIFRAAKGPADPYEKVLLAVYSTFKKLIFYTSCT